MKIEQSFGEWLPQNRRLVVDWVNKLIGDSAQNMKIKSAVDGSGAEQEFVHEEVTEFQQAVEEDPVLRLLAEQMIEQGYAYDPQDPTGKPQIHDLNTLFHAIDAILNIAPE